MILFFCMALWGTLPGKSEPFNTSKASFSINYRDETANYLIQSTFLLPGEGLQVKVISNMKDLSFSANMEQQMWQPVAENTWSWTAPEEVGHTQVVLGYGDPQDQIVLNIFIIEPFARVKDGYLNGYRIGTYPDKPLRDNPIYLPPRGFVLLTPEMEDIRVSPHFTLGQFVCKQAGGYPKYLALRARLLLKLEYLLELVNQKGHACDSFFVMSGFRTPFYNKSIGNVKYSRHQWGGAADIFIDESPKDGYPDDLNGDGKINHHDAMVLYNLIDAAAQKKEFKAYVGGMGRYRATASHGPFVHVDVRGFKARWGE